MKKKLKKVWRKLRPKPHMTRTQKALRWISLILTGGVLGFFSFAFFSAIVLSFQLPNPGELRDLNLTESTLIMDREGNVLYAIHGEENREALDNLDKVSPWLIDATIAIEDDKFYRHIGIDIPAILKAVASEFGIGTPRGGSTITQQFVKNTFLSSERTYKRKLQEIMLSLLVEVKFSKDEILLMYLNAIPYGSNAYGIQLASDRYFDKDATELTLAESAVLAGIPKAPTRYSPYGNYRYSTIHFELTEEYLDGRSITEESDLETEEWTRGLIGQTFELPNGESFYLRGRSDLILERMNELSLISDTEVDSALAEIQDLEFKPYSETIKAAHFVLWVKQQLEEKYGSAVVEQGGLKVYTTLDPNHQDAAEDAVTARWETNNESYGANNAALVSIQPETGQILAMVGSAGYFDTEDKVVTDGQVNMITSKRQPGSSFKPFVYALAFLNQYSPATVLYDVATKIGTDEPSNYDGEFMGPLSMRESLAYSRNIPAAKAYFLAGQEQEIIPFMRDLGLSSLKDEGYGWPLSLGAAEVTPLELAEAYTVFANNGVHLEPTPFLKIENADGEVLEQWDAAEVEKKEVLEPQVAYLINDVLSDPETNLGPNVRIDALDNASKTGTSNKPAENGVILPGNAWLAAYTPDLVTITWAGNADGSAMKSNASGYSTAAPIWKTYMNSILSELPGTQWTRPEGIKEVAISRASGKLPNEHTPSDMIKTEVFASFAVPTEIDDAYEVVEVESVSNRLATPYSPEDTVEERSYRVHHSILADRWPAWEEGVRKWAEEQDEASVPPTEYAEDIHNAKHAGNLPELVITSPSTLTKTDKRKIELEVDVTDEGNGLKEVTYYINGKVQYHSTEPPYSGNVRVPTSAQAGDILDIEAKAVDIYGYSDTASIEIRYEPDEE